MEWQAIPPEPRQNCDARLILKADSGDGVIELRCEAWRDHDEEQHTAMKGGQTRGVRVTWWEKKPPRDF